MNSSKQDQVNEYDLSVFTKDEQRIINADAALIAAAPEMHELLLDIGIHLKAGNKICPDRDAIVLNKIKTVIAKARGEK